MVAQRKPRLIICWKRTLYHKREGGRRADTTEMTIASRQGNTVHSGNTRITLVHNHSNHVRLSLLSVSAIRAEEAEPAIFQHNVPLAASMVPHPSRLCTG